MEIEKRKKIKLERSRLVEDVLFTQNAIPEDILDFRNEKKELIYNVEGACIRTQRLEERNGKKSIAEMLYFAGDNFKTMPDYWYEVDSLEYQKLKERVL